MICQSCRKAARLRAEIMVSAWHGSCKGGTWCDCAHVMKLRVDWFKVKLEDEERKRKQLGETCDGEAAEYSVPG